MVGDRVIVTVLGEQSHQVVVVDEGDVDLAGRHALDGRGVAVVLDGLVGEDALEPGASGVLALDDAQRGDERLERARWPGPSRCDRYHAGSVKSRIESGSADRSSAVV